jgi:hypothetical protein
MSLSLPFEDTKELTLARGPHEQQGTLQRHAYICMTLNENTKDQRNCCNSNTQAVRHTVPMAYVVCFSNPQDTMHGWTLQHFVGENDSPNASVSLSPRFI